MNSVLGELSDYHNMYSASGELSDQIPAQANAFHHQVCCHPGKHSGHSCSELIMYASRVQSLDYVHVVGHLIMYAWSVTWLCTRGQSLDYVRVVRHLIRHVVSHVIWHVVSLVIWHVFSHLIRNVVSHVIRHVISNLIMYTWSVTWLCTRGQTRDLTRGQSRDEACDLACLDQ